MKNKISKPQQLAIHNFYRNPDSIEARNAAADVGVIGDDGNLTNDAELWLALTIEAETAQAIADRTSSSEINAWAAGKRFSLRRISA